MKNFVPLLTKNKGKTATNGKTITVTFFRLYTVYIKTLKQFLLHSCSLTCLNKDTSVLLKNKNYLNKSIKTIILTSLKILCICAQSL